MPRILHVITDSDIRSSGCSLLNYLAFADRRSIDHFAAVPRHSLLTDRLRNYNIPVYELEDLTPAFSWLTIWRLSKLAKAIDADLIHSHNCSSALMAGKLCHIKTVFSFHSSDSLSNFIKDKKDHLLSRRSVSRNTSYVLVENALIENMLIEAGVPAEKINVLPYGVEPVTDISEQKKEGLCEAYGVNPQLFSIGVFNRLSQVNDFKTLIEAVALINSDYPRVRLIIAGTGELSSELFSYANLLNVSDEVFFAGFVRNTAGLMNVIDAVVDVSCDEGTSLSVLESMSFGLPIIAADGSGNLEIIRDNENGLVYEKNNAESLAEKIILLIEDSETIDYITANARLDYNRNYQGTQFAASLEDFYKACLAQTKQKSAIPYQN